MEVPSEFGAGAEEVVWLKVGSEKLRVADGTVLLFNAKRGVMAETTKTYRRRACLVIAF